MDPIKELPLLYNEPHCFNKDTAVDQIREGVRRFRTVIFPEQRELYESLAEKQQPCALFLTCGDSRIEPLLLTGTSLGLRDVLTQIHATI